MTLRRSARCGTVLVLTLTVGACHKSIAPGSTAEAPVSGRSAQAADERASNEQPTGHQNSIRWMTASEVDNFGYDVYRGEQPDGPFERITVEVVEGAGTTDTPQSYVFVDHHIDPYRTYYYYVESISLAGVRERFTPIAKADPKLPPRAGGGDR